MLNILITILLTHRVWSISLKKKKKKKANHIQQNCDIASFNFLSETGQCKIWLLIQKGKQITVENERRNWAIISVSTLDV